MLLTANGFDVRLWFVVGSNNSAVILLCILISTSTHTHTHTHMENSSRLVHVRGNTRGCFSQSVCLCVCGDHKSIALEIIRLSLAEPRRYSYISAQAQIHIQILTDTSTHRYKYRQSVLGNSLARLSLKVCPRHAVATLKCLFPIPIPQSIAIRTTPNHLTYIFFAPCVCLS